MTTPTIAADDRAFLELVSAAAFCNPFSAERTALDARIAGLTGAPAGDEVLPETVRQVAARVERLREQGLADVRRFRGRDAAVVEHAVLFDVFHRCAGLIDDLVARQMAAGEQVCPVPFARDALGRLEEAGFPPERADRYLAVFFQLRRAFRFIKLELVGPSASLCRLRMHLWNNVFTHSLHAYEDLLSERMEDFSTLLLGETGTGKGTAAAAIGRSGFIPFDRRRNVFSESFMRGFVAINLSQFPENLIESELFGHRRGAFTGAIDEHEGVFARCSSHGAILLDEIGDLPPHLQLKLLQVLQERTFTPVGSHQARRFSGRVIAATNRDLASLLRDGRFRQDFYYRLCSDVILVPPLRERVQEDPAELDCLVEHALGRIVGARAPAGLGAGVRAAIERSPGPGYAWPGNVRELEQCVRRILVTGSYEPNRLAQAGDAGAAGLFAERLRQQPLSAEDLLNAYCALLYQGHGRYEAVARLTGLDRRTVKRRVTAWGCRRPAG